MNARRSGLHNATRLCIHFARRCTREKRHVYLSFCRFCICSRVQLKNNYLSRTYINPLVAPHQGSPDAERVLRVTLTSGCCRARCSATAPCWWKKRYSHFYATRLFSLPAACWCFTFHALGPMHRPKNHLLCFRMRPTWCFPQVHAWRRTLVPSVLY
jgi:hypothetical protein